MGLTIRTLREQQEANQSMGMFISPARLWHNSDRTKIVPDGDPEAAFLLLAKGEEIPMAEAQKLGLVKVDKKPADKTGPKPQDKTGKKPADK